ncbi:MAG TPA: hypothetical protein VFO07_18945 [Roseiflexaceae bacterium]|nr:hypothetical protein [Roseiflexaceae bacterium]
MKAAERNIPSQTAGMSWRTAWLLMGSVFGCLLAAGALAVFSPPRFQTHDEAVGYVLDQHGIAHDEVRLSRAWPDTLSREAYSADVVVRLRDAEQIKGRIECKVQRSQCLLYLRRLGIWREPVPELAVIPPWLAQFQGWLSSLFSFARDLVNV